MTDSVLDKITGLIGRAGLTSPDQGPPQAILWPDPAREFDRLTRRVSTVMPVLTLGDYDPEAGDSGVIEWDLDDLR